MATNRNRGVGADKAAEIAKWTIISVSFFIKVNVNAMRRETYEVAYAMRWQLQKFNNYLVKVREKEGREEADQLIR